MLFLLTPKSKDFCFKPYIPFIPFIPVKFKSTRLGSLPVFSSRQLDNRIAKQSACAALYTRSNRPSIEFAWLAASFSRAWPERISPWSSRASGGSFTSKLPRPAMFSSEEVMLVAFQPDFRLVQYASDKGIAFLEPFSQFLA